MPYTQAELLDALHELIQTTGRPVPVGFDRFRVAPPSARYIDASDRLFIQSWNSQITDNGPIAIVLRGRILTPDGRIHSISREHAPATDRSRTFTDFRIQEGYLLSLTVLAQAFTPNRGACFVQVGLARGPDVATEINEVLISGYLEKRAALSWPGNRPYQSIEELGNLRYITGSNPAAGVEISETVPTNALWRFRAFRAQLVTGVAVASRQVNLVFDAGGLNVIYRYGTSPSTQAASLTRDYSCGFYGSDLSGAVPNFFVNTGGDLYLRAGDRIRTVTNSFQAADDWGAPSMLIEEWIEDRTI